jgi:hypothetical protein
MLLITLTQPFSAVLFEAKSFYGRNALGKIFSETLVNQKSRLMEKNNPKGDFSLFFAAFCRGNFHCGNVFAIVFLRYKNKRVKPDSFSGGKINK